MELFWLPVPKVGIEPTLPKEHDFESCASTNSATLANSAVFRPPASNREANIATTGNFVIGRDDFVSLNDTLIPGKTLFFCFTGKYGPSPTN